MNGLTMNKWPILPVIIMERSAEPRFPTHQNFHYVQ